MALETALAERLERVEGRIVDACDRAGRARDEVRVVAVTKTHAPAVNEALVGLGVVDQGESRVRDLAAKAGEVVGVSWHFVGRLQRNKAKDAVAASTLIHSVDRRSLAETLGHRAAATGSEQEVLVQVNVGDDPAKAGCPAEQALDLVATARATDGLRVVGLMTIPPAPPDQADANGHARPHFARLAGLRNAARDRWPEVRELSMGMSADLEAAVESGATIVRVGTALLGPRQDPPWAPR